MDPITATTTLITLASFMKDLVELGQSVRDSIEKVAENRRQIRDLANDVRRTLVDLSNLTRGKEELFQTPALLSALGNLKSEMLYVLSSCREIAPAERRPGIRGLKSQIKVWMKRDDIEAKIRRLKAHTNQCYLTFTTFSVARVEQMTTRIDKTTARIEDVSLDGVNTTLRVEQMLIVNNVESQVKLRRLEGLMARVLLETSFGQSVIERTIGIMSSDPGHTTLESQYLSAQTMSLVVLTQQSMAAGMLVLDMSLWTTTIGIGEVESVTPTNVLHSVLAVILYLQGSKMEMESLNTCVVRLGTRLRSLGLVSEAVAWELLTCQNLRRSAGGEYSAVVMPRLARSLRRLSAAYRDQLQYESALRASEQSLDIWRYTRDSSDFHDHIHLLRTIRIHVKNLLQTSSESSALPFADEAVTIARPILRELIDSNASLCRWDDEDKYIAGICLKTFFTLAHALASAGRSLEAFEASMEGFKFISQLPKSVQEYYRPSAQDISCFLEQMCTVAEGGGFSLDWLENIMLLFRDLARLQRTHFSRPFLQLLHAYVYYFAQVNSPGPTPVPQNLRVFLNITSTASVPSLEPFDHPMYLGFGEIVEDVIHAFYARPKTVFWRLFRNIFIANCGKGLDAFREEVDRLCSEYPSSKNLLAYTVEGILQLLWSVSKENRSPLLDLLKKIMEHLGSNIVHISGNGCLEIFRQFWREGLFSDALAILDPWIEVYRSTTNSFWLRFTLLHKASISCDMGRVHEAIEAIRALETECPFPRTQLQLIDNHGFSLYCRVRIRILRYMSRSQEALQLLRKLLSWNNLEPEIESDRFIDPHLQVLLVELAATQRDTRELHSALQDAERAATTCRENADSQNDKGALAALVYALVELGDCLAEVGKHDEAFKVSEEAVLIYTQNVPRWKHFVLFARHQQLGASAFHALSRRHATSGEFDKAFSNAEKATNLYRQLVSLARWYLPDLASSLQNLALILAKLDCRREATVTCEEAVDVLREVTTQADYFLPNLVVALDQLAALRQETGDVMGASAARSECAGVKRRLDHLPPPTDILFPEVFGDTETEAPTEEFTTEPATVSVECETLNAAVEDIPVPDPGSTLAIGNTPCPTADAEDAEVAHELIGVQDREKDDAANAVSTFLRTSFKVRFELSATPVDMLWWTLALVGGLSVLVVVLSMVLATLWIPRGEPSRLNSQ